MFQVVYTSFSMGVDIGSSSFVWHLWFLLRVSTNLPDSFKFPIALFSYCVVMMLMIELYWTYASYCVLIHIFLTRTGLHNTYKRTHTCFHNWGSYYCIILTKCSVMGHKWLWFALQVFRNGSWAAVNTWPCRFLRHFGLFCLQMNSFGACHGHNLARDI